MTTSGTLTPPADHRQQRFIQTLPWSLGSIVVGVISAMVLVTVQGNHTVTFNHGDALLIIDATPGLAFEALAYACAMIAFRNWVKASTGLLLATGLGFIAIYWLVVLPSY